MPVSARLILVCHASTSAVRRHAFGADEPLDTHGTAQATAAAGTLGRVSGAWRAPTLRCAQTATALGLDTQVDPELRDCDFGRWSGRELTDVQAEEPDAVAAWLTAPAAAPHGGESVTQLLARSGGWLDGRPWPAGQTVAVTHPAVIRAAVVHAIDATVASFWRIDVAPLSRTVLSGRPGRWTLHTIG